MSNCTMLNNMKTRALIKLKPENKANVSCSIVVFSFIKQLSNATDTEVTWTIKYKFQINMLKQEQNV